MKQEKFDFYDKTTLKSYNLDQSMRYQLDMLDRLDVFTRKHSENVASLTCRICEYLHCNKGFTEYCTICAYLHDIGKQFIPPEILQKPNQLTDEEFEIMKKHTTIGYNMCMKDLKMRPYAAGPLYHHEALDGSGYPQGLTKKDIPYEAQIIRVADEYDAIVSKRQYKTHVGIADTLKIISSESKPNKTVSSSDALNEMAYDTKIGKNNPVIVKALFKVIIDDISYEIVCTQNYIDNLNSNLKRFEQIEKYAEKMNMAKDEKTKNYYKEGITQLFRPEENFENYMSIYSDYKNAYAKQVESIKKLYDEIKIIKKLKI